MIFLFHDAIRASRPHKRHEPKLIDSTEIHKIKQVTDFILFAPISFINFKTDLQSRWIFWINDKVYPVHPTRGSPTVEHRVKHVIWVLPTEDIE